MTFLTLHSARLKKMGLNKILDRPNLMPGAAIIPSPEWLLSSLPLDAFCLVFYKMC